MSTRRWIVGADRGSLLGLALGLLLMCSVDAAWAFRAGFFVLLGSTVAQILFSHLAAAARAQRERAP